MLFRSPDNIKADLTIHPVKWVDEVLELALQQMPKPLSDEEYSKSSDSSLSGDSESSSQSTSRISTH